MRLFVLLSLICFLLGCNTMKHGINTDISFYSNSSDMTILMGNKICSVPCKITIHRTPSNKYTIENLDNRWHNKIGTHYNSTAVEMLTSFPTNIGSSGGNNNNGGVIIILALWMGVVGIGAISDVVDTLTGASWVYDVNNIYLYKAESGYVRIYDVDKSAFAFVSVHYSDMLAELEKVSNVHIDRLSNLINIKADKIKLLLRENDQHAFMDKVVNIYVSNAVANYYRHRKTIVAKKNIVQLVTAESREDEVYVQLLLKKGTPKDFIYKLFYRKQLEEIRLYSLEEYTSLKNTPDESSLALYNIYGIPMDRLVELAKTSENANYFADLVERELASRQ